MNLLDLDTRLLGIPSPTSRAYVWEAIQAHRAGAQRAAVVSIWIAVVWDFLEKLRLIADAGEAAAKGLIKELDKAIAHDDKRALLNIESDLLKRCRDEFGFITSVEFIELDRLREDRHRCAHPAFHGTDGLFQPSPDQVRAHIAHAIELAISKPAVFGKSLLERLKADLMSLWFPDSVPAVTSYIRTKYIDVMKPAMVDTIIVVLLKVLLQRTEPDLNGREERVVHTLLAFKYLKADAYESTVRAKLEGLVQAPNENEAMMWLLLLLNADAGMWTLLTPARQIQLANLARRLNWGQYGIPLPGLMAINDLRTQILSEMSALPQNEQISWIGRFPCGAVLDIGVATLLASNNWRTAETRGKVVLGPLAAFFDAARVQMVLQGIEQNSQLREAGEMPALLASFYQHTRGLLPETRQFWCAFLQAVVARATSATDHYAYPVLRSHMVADGVWTETQGAATTAT